MRRKTLIDHYEPVEVAFNELSLLYTLLYFKSCGIDVSQQRFEFKDLILQLRPDIKYIKFIKYMLYSLAKYNHVLYDNDFLAFNFKANVSESIATLTTDIRSKFPKYVYLLDFINHCAMNYKAVLSGTCSGVGVFYPAADVSFLQPIIDFFSDLYDIDYQYKILNELLADDSKDELKSIIEVGGGSGQLTWRIVPELDANNVNYHFTDISRFFVTNAHQKSKDNNINAMSFGVLDISKDPGSQGFTPQSFNVVLALNVIHATENVLETLTQLKKLLAPGGMIYIVEHTSLPLWANMSWGLFDGWWNFNDPMRKLLPIMAQESWLQILNQAGFTDIQTFLSPDKSVKTFFHILGY